MLCAQRLSPQLRPDFASQGLGGLSTALCAPCVNPALLEFGEISRHFRIT